MNTGAQMIIFRVLSRGIIWTLSGRARYTSPM